MLNFLWKWAWNPVKKTLKCCSKPSTLLFLETWMLLWKILNTWILNLLAQLARIMLGLLGYDENDFETCIYRNWHLVDHYLDLKGWHPLEIWIKLVNFSLKFEKCPKWDSFAQGGKWVPPKVFEVGYWDLNYFYHDLSDFIWFLSGMCLEIHNNGS